MFIEMLMLMVVGHFIADYPLQGDFLSKAKNHKQPIPGVPWYQALTAHSAIHAGFVGVITGSIMIGLFEFVIHWVIDFAKCDGRLSFNQDQVLHILCKCLWVIIYPALLLW